MTKYRLLKEQVQSKEDELYQLELERTEILADYKEALAQGDLSENSAYISSKQRLQHNQLQLDAIHELLNNYEIVDESEINNDIVDVGSKVTLTDESNKDFTFTFVTEGQGSIVKKTISQKSDIGNAIYGKSVGDQVEVKSTSGEVHLYRISAIG